MRYLTENTNYYIVYDKRIGMSSNKKGQRIPVLQAWLMDYYGNNPIYDHEHYKGKLEPCLMKLGKRLQEKWRNRKK